MWRTCLPRRLERIEEVFDDGADCFFTDLNPVGGLKAGAGKATEDLV